MDTGTKYFEGREGEKEIGAEKPELHTNESSTRFAQAPRGYGYETEESQEKEAIKTTLRTILNRAVSGPNSAEKEEKISKFIREHSEYSKYELFALLSGNNSSPADQVQFDSEGGEIQNFIENL